MELKTNRTMRKKFFKSFLLFTLLLVPTLIFAQSTEEKIKTMLIERDQEIKELLGDQDESSYTDSQRNQLKEIINGVIDFSEMAKIALGDTYNTISVEEREEFVNLFSTIIRDQSLNKLEIYKAKVTYTNVEVNGEKSSVETLAELDNIRTPVSYDLMLKNGNWIISDMAIDDVSTADSYNRQFQRIIARNGFESLMNSLRKRAARA